MVVFILCCSSFFCSKKGQCFPTNFLDCLLTIWTEISLRNLLNNCASWCTLAFCSKKYLKVLSVKMEVELTPVMLKGKKTLVLLSMFSSFSFEVKRIFLQGMSPMCHRSQILSQFVRRILSSILTNFCFSHETYWKARLY